MAGARQAKDTPLEFQPGIITNLTDRDAVGRYKASNRVRWHKGLPEKLGGWIRQTLTGANGGVYIGVARALHDWASLDTQQWISIGTHCKLYALNNGRLSDITPMRLALNLSGALSVQAGSNVITVSAPDHRSNVGDHIAITASANIGGFSVSGLYDIEDIPTPDTFTVHFGQNFNSTEVGGGSITIEFDIRCGLPQNGERRGYGTGLFGMGTYGTPRPVGSGVPARMRTWSLQNWGEDLLASPSDGELYWWDRTTGPNSRAVLIEEAPVAIQRMLVNAQNRHVILLGCTGLDGVPDPMRIRWCEQENFRGWDPTVFQTAGGKRLDHGSRLITGIASRSTNYVWSDTMMYSLQYVGTPDVFLPTELGTMKIVGPNAACDREGIAFAMAFDDFMIYDGTLRPLICEIHTLVFGDESRNVEGNFDRTQAEAVYCAPYSAKNEVTWWYPGTDDQIHYATYNTVLQRWYAGTMPRTAYHDVSEAITGYKTNPYGVNGGYLYKHEVGTDEVEGDESFPQAWFLETYDINAGGSDGIFIVNHLIPNFDRFAGGMRVWLKKKTKPQQPTYQLRGPYLCLPSTLDLGVRCKASQMAIRWESRGELGEDWRMGVWQQNATPYGGRMGVHIEADEAPGAPTLSGEVVTEADTDPVVITAGFDNFDVFLGYSDGSILNESIGALVSGDVGGTYVREIYYFVAADIFHIALDVQPQDYFSGVVISGDNGDVTLLSQDAQYMSDEDSAEWDWTDLTLPFSEGENYTITFNMSSQSRAALSWTAASPGSSPIAGYRLYNADTDALIDELDALTFDDGPPKAPGTYRYYVVAYDESGAVSAPSNVVTLVVT